MRYAGRTRAGLVSGKQAEAWQSEERVRLEREIHETHAPEAATEARCGARRRSTATALANMWSASSSIFCDHAAGPRSEHEAVLTDLRCRFCRAALLGGWLAFPRVLYVQKQQPLPHSSTRRMRRSPGSLTAASAMRFAMTVPLPDFQRWTDAPGAMRKRLARVRPKRH